ncbi:MAG: hypothetical protein HYR56_26400 [Acidobacteria bacterium]|nr:hypothetical protein [Acidobacteriota bacterium]MBI3422561.1 hypothetical protein [Acidobacteriota bacterium]
MKLNNTLGSLLCLLLAGLALADTKPNFSGNWVLDKDRSNGKQPGFDQTISVKHTGDQLTLETKQKTARGEVAFNESYAFNGQEMDFEPQGMPPGSKGKRSATWLPNGRGILVNDTVTGADGKLVRKMTRKWQLSADGNTLTIDYYIDDPQRGEYEMKRIFNKTP